MADRRGQRRRRRRASRPRVPGHGGRRRTPQPAAPRHVLRRHRARRAGRAADPAGQLTVLGRLRRHPWDRSAGRPCPAGLVATPGRARMPARTAPRTPSGARPIPPHPSFSTLAPSPCGEFIFTRPWREFRHARRRCGLECGLLGQPARDRSVARRAPSASEPSLAQQMSGSIAPKPAQVPKPQSVPAITRSGPTISAKRSGSAGRPARGARCSWSVESSTPGASILSSGIARVAPHRPLVRVARVGRLEQDRRRLGPRAPRR